MRDRQVATFLAQWEGFSRGMISSEKPNQQMLLSHVLESASTEKYYLSPTACRGILRRAEKRGKSLPEQLRLALLAVAEQQGLPQPDSAQEIAQSPDQ